MNCVKRLGQSLMARPFERQVVEMHVRIAVLNRFTAIGTPITMPVAELRPGSGLSVVRYFETDGCLT